MFRRTLAGIALGLISSAASASFESWRFEELYSNADGTMQYVVLKEAFGFNGMDNLGHVGLTASHQGNFKSFGFGHDLPSMATAYKFVLIATQAVADTGLITPDYIMPDRFLPTDGGIVNFGDVISYSYSALPTDGNTALFTSGILYHNVATNFAGASASVAAGPITVIEFYNAGLDHYFVSPLAPDIDALDTGRYAGWARTGLTFKAYATQAIGGAGVKPVCRFYIPPQHGDSHFFSADATGECAAVLAKIKTDPNYSGFDYETPNAFYIGLPDTTTGICPEGVNVYRLWNQRADSNHRYTRDPNVKAQMIAKGYVAEGYGLNAVAMCAPQ